MDISVRDIREKLIPIACDWRIGCRHCNDERCSKALKSLQEWLDDILAMDKNELKIMGKPKDWTR